MWTTQTILCSMAALTALTTASQIDPTTTNGVNLDSVLFEALFGGAEVGQCTRCLVANCCSNGLKCKADGHDGSCTTCTGQSEFPCGENCCNGGEECNGGSCTIPLQIQEAYSLRGSSEKIVRSSTSSSGDTLSRGDSLHAGDKLWASNKAVHLDVQDDGNMVLYEDSVGVRWASNSHGDASSQLYMQGDGNLVLYSNNKVLWASNTNKGAKLVVQADCNVVLYNDDNSVGWASNTSPCKSSPQVRSIEQCMFISQYIYVLYMSSL